MAVETIYKANNIFNGMGENVSDAKTSKEVINLAGLNWTVSSQPVYLNSGVEIPNTYANVRDSDNSVLGVVSERYKIVQNSEAFEFVDELLGQGVTYETAGSLRGGKRTWVLAKMESFNVLDDKVMPYLVFSNTFDKTGAMKVASVPIRVVCENTLSLALKRAERTFTIRHTGDINGKIEEARKVLNIANTYNTELQTSAEKLVDIKLSEGDVADIVTLLLPYKNVESNRQTVNTNLLRETLRNIYEKKEDIAKFKGTAWGMVNAVADFEPHIEPLRQTATAKENKAFTIVDTSPLMTAISKYFKMA